MEKAVAMRLSAVVKECSLSLEAQLVGLQEFLDANEFSTIKRGIARTLTTMDTAIVQYLVEQHPEADPWRQTPE